MRTITCPCGATATAEGAYCTNVGEITKQTGFAVYFDRSHDLGYLCPDCQRKITPHVAAIIEAFGERGFQGSMSLGNIITAAGRQR